MKIPSDIRTVPARMKTASNFQHFLFVLACSDVLLDQDIWLVETATDRGSLEGRAFCLQVQEDNQIISWGSRAEEGYLIGTCAESASKRAQILKCNKSQNI